MFRLPDIQQWPVYLGSQYINASRKATNSMYWLPVRQPQPVCLGFQLYRMASLIMLTVTTTANV